MRQEDNSERQVDINFVVLSMLRAPSDSARHGQNGTLMC